MAAAPHLPGATSYETHVQRDLAAVPKLFSDILTSYSGIPQDQQAAHITRVRDTAYAHCPYPCIGNFRFLGLDLAAHPAYTEHVLAPLRRQPSPGSGPSAVSVPASEAPLFLDVGTCFGQDVRKLVYDGADAERIYASDVSQVLIDCGFDMFRDDADTHAARDLQKPSRDHFLCPGDMLLTAKEDIAKDKLIVLHDRVDILHITTVFHLFPLEQQKAVADRCLQLLRKPDPDRPTTSGELSGLILGGQVGSAEPGHFLRKNQTHEFSHMYRHNVHSWRALWDEVASRPEWKSRIKKLEVKSRLVKRVMDWKAGTIAFPQPSEADWTLQDGGSGPLWHQFEVRVVFDH